MIQPFNRSPGDMTKQAMIDVCKIKLPLLQIHDELAFSVDSPAEAEALARIMENAAPLSVPNNCDVDIGPNWGEAIAVT